MNRLEKSYSTFAVIFTIVLISSLVYFPVLRQLKVLLALSLLGLTVNVGLMFVVLKDIFSRQFSNPSIKYSWIVIVLLLWPALLYYLPKHGFKQRKSDSITTENY